MTPRVACHSQRLLQTLLSNPLPLTESQKDAAGRAARQILGFAWTQIPRNSWLVTSSLASVCQTFGTDSAASAALLRQAIQREHLAQHGCEEMYWVAQEILAIAEHNADLAGDVFISVFGFEESSRAETYITGSQILSLRSDRAQEYNQAKWLLSEKFAQFAESWPVAAARVVSEVIGSYGTKKSTYPLPRHAFEFNGMNVGIIEDYSSVWDEKFHSHDCEVKILDTFFKMMDALVADAPSAHQIDRILLALTDGARPAAIWRRLLKLGSHYPESIGLKLRSLAWASPLYLAQDTRRVASDFVQAMFPLLQKEDKLRVESVITKLPESVPLANRGAAERIRDCVLGQLRSSEAATESGNNHVENTGVAPEDARGIDDVRIEFYPEDQDDGAAGTFDAAVSDPAAGEIIEHYQAVKMFVDTWRDGALSNDGIDESVFASIRRLRSVLGKRLIPGNNRTLTAAWCTLARACALIVSTESFSCDSDDGGPVLALLFDLSQELAATEQNGRGDADGGSQGGMYSARIEAAQGLISSTRNESCCHPEIIDAIERLAVSNNPEVRVRIVGRLNNLYEFAPDRMWALFEALSHRETDNLVLAELVNAIYAVAETDPERTSMLVERVFSAVSDGRYKEETRGICNQALVELYARHDTEVARAFVFRRADDPSQYLDDVTRMLSSLRGLLAYGDERNPSGIEEEVRRRAIRLFHAIVDATSRSVICAFDTSAPPGTGPLDAATVAAMKILDVAARELYFASGVFNSEAGRGPCPPCWQLKRFYDELVGTIEKISTSGHPSTAHNLVKLLARLVTCDPKRAFLQIANVVRNGGRFGYQYESLAVDEIADLAKRFIAEQRVLLQGDAECRRALREILEGFIEAGWPAAQSLCYRFDDIYR